MNDHTKLLAATALLPVLADLIEDVPMNQQAKQTRNRMVAGIRSYDRLFTDAKCDTEEEYRLAMEQQLNIQIAFRQWLNELFKEV